MQNSETIKLLEDNREENLDVFLDKIPKAETMKERIDKPDFV